MWTATSTPDERISSATRGPSLTPRSSIIDDPFEADKEYGFGSAFSSAFIRENTLISTINELSDGDSLTAEDIRLGRESNHNPYTWLRENYDDEQLRLLSPFISQGDFETAVSPRLTKAYADEILYELELQKQMEGSFLGTLSGSILTALIDPTTYIPFVGPIGRASRLGKTGLFALNAALSSGVSEAVLQQTQRARQLEETIMNIGVSAALGGGLGMFAGSLGRSNPLHTRNPNNPLRRENLYAHDEVIRTMDGKTDTLSADEISDLRRLATNDSAGAARVPGTDLVAARIARSDPKTALGRAARYVSDAFNSVTPAGRIVRASSDTARAVGLRLADVGGILLDTHLQGKALAPSAEIIKRRFMADTDKLFMKLENAVYKVNQELGKTRFSRGRVTPKDMNQLTQRMLYGMEDEALEARIRDKHGDDGFEIIRKAAAENAEEVHKFNEEWEKRLIDEGLLQNAERISYLEGELASLKAQIKALDKKVDAAQLKKLRTQRDSVKKALRQEKAKAAPLGRNYGHAQLWNAEAIMESPSDFKAYLLDALAVKPDEDWLIEYYEITSSQLDAMKLDPSRQAEYRSILTEWAGDAYYARLRKAEMEVKAADEKLKEATLDVREALHALRKAERREESITLSEARKRRDLIAAEVADRRLRKESLAKELRAFREAAAAARSHTMDRQMRVGQTNKEVRRDQIALGVSRTESQLQQTIDDVLTDPATPVDAAGQPRVEDAGDVAQLSQKLQRGEERNVQADAAVRQDQDDVSISTARRQGKVEQMAKELDALTKELEVSSARLADLDAKLQYASDLKKQRTALRRQLDEALNEARAEHKIAAKDLSKVKRALLKTRKSTPLDEMVDDIYESIVQSGRIGVGILDRVANYSDKTTGRVKERVIHLDNDLRMEAIRRGWLNDDLAAILYRSSDQLSAEIAIRQGLGIGEGRQFSSWGDVLRMVEDDYSELLEHAADEATRNRLRKERKTMTADLVELRDRLKSSTPDPDGTASGAIRWAASKARQMNFLRYGGGFLLSSLTDIATFALRHSAKDVARFARKAIRDMRDLRTDNPTEFQAFVRSAEIAMGASASARRFGSDDLIHGANANYGIGYGRARRATAAVDRVMERTGEIVSHGSGLPVWNRYWKTVAALSMNDKLARMTKDFDSLSDVQRADLTSLGIGRDEARKIAGFIEKYGKEDDGLFDPGLEHWDGPEGVEMARIYEMAIIRDMDRAINTPGIGDTPRLMSKWHGKLLFQFQTFAFTFMNRYAYPVMQRASLFKDRQAFMSMGLLVATATMVVIGSDLRNNRDPSERFTEEKLAETLHEIIDRSGMMGWLSPYADSVLKLTSPITGYGGNNRYARNGWAESLLGVNYALFQDIQKAGAAVTNNDPDVFRKIAILAPFSSWIRLAHSMATDD